MSNHNFTLWVSFGDRVTSNLVMPSYLTLKAKVRLGLLLSGWWNDKMLKWQNDKMAKWWNVRLVKWQNDKMPGGWNGKMTKCHWQNSKISGWPNGKMMNCQIGEVAKCQMDEMAKWLNVNDKIGKYWVDQMTKW